MKTWRDGNSIAGWRLLALLLVMVAASVAIHGYHYGIEDEAIYLPAIKAHLNSALYPHDAAFFEPQTQATLFDDLVAATARLLGTPVDSIVFCYFLGTLLAFYAGLWALARRLFPGVRGQLGGVLLIGTLLTMPVAGTCIFIVDQHLHPRTLATGMILWAAALVARRTEGEALKAREYLLAALLLAGAAAFHIQMAFYGAMFVVVLMLPSMQVAGKLAAVMGGFIALAGYLVAKGGPEWQEASRTRAQHYLMRWEWYELLGAIAPIFILAWMGRFARRKGFPVAASVASRTALFALLGVLAGCLIAIPPQMERLTPFQPLRTLHLTYVVMLLVAGGLLAELALKDKLWRWALLLLPIAAGMTFAQVESFPDSHHVEWPGRSTGNDWVEAFDWVKANTPVDAYFALDPHYMSSPGEDYHGFRGLAERGQMADWDKDPGVVLLFPWIAPRWSREVHALDHWKDFTAEDFHRLHERFGVGWTVLAYGPKWGRWGKYAGEYPIPLSDCVWHNRSVMVCKVK